MTDVVDDDDHLDGLRSLGLPVVERRPSVDRRVSLTMSASASALVAEAWAPATRHAYEQSWARFAAWCHATRRLDPLDATPGDLADYVAYHVQAGLSPAYLSRNLAAINAVFDMADLTSPARHPIVRRAADGAKRVTGSGQRRAAPLRLDELRKIVNGMAIVTGRPPTDLMIRRDRSMLLLGWAAALRESELVALDVDDLTFTGDPDRGDGGVLIRLSRSKGDPGSKGATVAVPYSTRIGSCPVRSTMLLARTQKTGPLYRKIDRHGRQLARLTPEAVNTIVRRHVDAVLGADPALYSSHSLRAGWVTEARANGVPAQDIMRHTRHTDARMLHVYDRPADLLEAHPMRGEWW
ncbi:MAG: tyrosine-type recombinase/integrase [Ilumatobacteraceae bacterium]